MLSRIRDRNIWLVYATIFLLGVAYGSSLSVTPLQLAKLEFSKPQIGWLASIFAGGIVAGSLPAGSTVRRFGAKRAMLVALVIYAASVALFPLQRTFAGAALVRALDGASSVSIWVACETVLLARSNKENKAFIMSLYGMSIAIGYVVGSGVARLVVLALTYVEVFYVAGALALAAALVILALLDPAAQLPPEEKLTKPTGSVAEGDKANKLAEPTAPVAEGDKANEVDGEPSPMLDILWRIKTACLATFSYGYFQASVVLFLPLYLVQDKNIPEKSTILMTAFFAGGMLVFSSIVGRVGDAIGHLRTMTLLACVGLAMIFGFIWLDSWTLMLAAIFIAGATLASISPLSLALQGHIVSPRDYSRANSLYNTCYALGMLAGPPASSALFEGPGGKAMLFHLAALWSAFITFTLVFRRDDPREARALAPSTIGP